MLFNTIAVTFPSLHRAALSRQGGGECAKFANDVRLVRQEHVQISAGQFNDLRVGDTSQKIALPLLQPRATGVIKLVQS